MADEADRGTEAAERHLNEALANAKRGTGPHLEPVGECHNCGIGVGPKQVFCDGECESEHSYYLHRLAVNGRRG